MIVCNKIMVLLCGKALKKDLLEKRNNFIKIYNHTKNFVRHVQNVLEECELDITLELDLPEKRVRIAKHLTGESASDESGKIFNSPTKQFEIEVFKVILDNAQQQLDKRFVSNEEVLEDIAWLDPRNFCKITNDVTSAINQKSLVKIAEFTKVHHGELLRELRQFAMHYNAYHDGFKM